MKNLSNLKPNENSNHYRKRLGRGMGSGLGKTGGKGHKGQRARKSSDVATGFEGGQMPLYRRLPKRGFFNIFAKQIAEVNVGELNGFEPGAVINLEALKKAGLAGKTSEYLKILGKGELKKKLNISADAVSTGAKTAIEKAGGKIDLIPPRVNKKLKAKRPRGAKKQ